MDRTKLDHIVNLVSAILLPAGYDCIEAEWSSHDRILRLFTDKILARSSDDEPLALDLASPREKNAGIDLDDIVKVSRLLAEVPELDAAIPGNYTLEVSSPGIERPLRRPGDFKERLGATVQVRLAVKVQDRRNGVGVLASVDAGSGADDTQITLQTEQGPWSFPLATLQRASLVYDWTKGP